MDQLNGATIFWLITLGLVAGGTLKLFLGDKGLSIVTNLVGGVIGALIVGIISIKLNVPGSLLLGLMGTMAILFISNVFFIPDNPHAHEPEETHP